MRLWLNRSADVPLREQLITQVVLAILTREVLPGQRLPSTRELARRFGIHPNTASAAYRQLEQEGWLELRHGSGVFVSSARRARSLSSQIAPYPIAPESAASESIASKSEPESLAP
jgi:DNA-binding transcriptional regulator YhcF (GntR family)